jgi:hypothetical protein
MRNRKLPCPSCEGPTQIIRTRIPADAFRIGLPQTPDMSRPGTLVECCDEDYGWAVEVRPATTAAEAAVTQLDVDLHAARAITDENARAQAQAEAEQRFLTAAAKDEPS